MLGGAAVAAAFVQNSGHRVGAYAHFLGERKCFSGDGKVGCHDQVVDELCGLAASNRAEVDDRTSEHVEYRLTPGKLLGFASNEQDEVTRVGCVGATGHRRIENINTSFGGQSSQLNDSGWVGSRVHDDQRPGRASGQYPIWG